MPLVLEARFLYIRWENFGGRIEHKALGAFDFNVKMRITRDTSRIQAPSLGGVIFFDIEVRFKNALRRQLLSLVIGGHDRSLPTHRIIVLVRRAPHDAVTALVIGPLYLKRFEGDVACPWIVEVHLLRNEDEVRGQITYVAIIKLWCWERDVCLQESVKVYLCKVLWLLIHPLSHTIGLLLLVIHVERVLCKELGVQFGIRLFILDLEEGLASIIAERMPFHLHDPLD
mmetsp:Transcript_49561/g.106062  ORF Transcript_49561/g.106062 Transcript_49561/m.106062 type:complete len:228 (-) Transcript_49561:611-1294(-)